ncbi:hypothetical protein BCR34DRAFT_165038 [Clohesyomyces aquaticus]|uniref:Uncharacterized protein n=1 Tax=Clohesyomyces aquaticus TaxID=1231657 RepID=A0A1Y1YHM1_9PLEO|nr:hypothetical protein BCR34DRAFT_165038 [Clohesyomyces aquaticus]
MLKVLMPIISLSPQVHCRRGPVSIGLRVCSERPPPLSSTRPSPQGCLIGRQLHIRALLAQFVASITLGGRPAASFQGGRSLTGAFLRASSRDSSRSAQDSPRLVAAIVPRNRRRRGGPSNASNAPVVGRFHVCLASICLKSTAIAFFATLDSPLALLLIGFSYSGLERHSRRDSSPVNRFRRCPAPLHARNRMSVLDTRKNTGLKGLGLRIPRHSADSGLVLAALLASSHRMGKSMKPRVRLRSSPG